MTTTDTPDLPEDLPEGQALHMGIAEQGMVYALEGDHTRALACYRTAMHMSVAAGDPEVFFRHYLECVTESLELMGAYDEVIQYCDKALAMYGDTIPEQDLLRCDLAHLHQKRGAVLLKKGQPEEARASLEAALAVVKGTEQKLPLTERLLRWVQMGMSLDVRRIEDEQRRHAYFSVREDNVDPDRAIRLPDEVIMAGTGL